jgi:hypothetical protein
MSRHQVLGARRARSCHRKGVRRQVAWGSAVPAVGKPQFEGRKEKRYG